MGVSMCVFDMSEKCLDERYVFNEVRVKVCNENLFTKNNFLNLKVGSGVDQIS